MIEGKSTEDVSGQICAQYGLMDHINLGRSTPVREQKEGWFCFFVFHTTFFVFGDTTNIVWTGEAQKQNILQ